MNGEVTYCDYPGAPLVTNIVNLSVRVPEPYGGPATNFLAKEATGGWVTTTIDLLRFINGLDGLRGGPLFTPPPFSYRNRRPGVWRFGPGNGRAVTRNVRELFYLAMAITSENTSHSGFVRSCFCASADILSPLPAGYAV